MLDLKNTRFFNTEQRPVVAGHVISDEGAACIYVKDGQETKTRMSTGAADEIFAGFSLSRNVPPSFLPNAEEGVVSDKPVTIARLPIAGQIGISVAGVALTVVAGDPADETEAKLAADVVTFHADADGDKYEILYQYEPTVGEANMLTGDAPIGNLSSTVMGSIGLITDGDVSTSFFDAGADWSGAINPTLGVDGLLTVGGSGTVLKQVTVLNTPSASNPMLTVRVKV